MENWRLFCEELTEKEIENCRNKGHNQKECERHYMGKIECGKQVGDYDNKKWCPPGKNCNPRGICVPCHPVAGYNIAGNPNYEYSNCDGKKKLPDKVIFDRGSYKIIRKGGKMLVNKRIPPTHPDYHKAKKDLRRAKRIALDAAINKLNMQGR